MRSKRKMIVVLLGAALLCTTATPEAQAKPSFGSNCLSCHDYDGNIMEVTGHDDVVGLPLRLDGGTSAGLRTFVVTAGQSIALKVNVLYGNSKYSVSLRHLDGRGVEQSTSNRLVFTPDSGWRDRGDYYTTSVTSWNGSARVHTFNLAVDAATPPDFYALETQTGRKGGGEWAQDK